MPEGPETWRGVRRIAAAIAGKRVERFETTLPALRRGARAVEGKLVEAVEARGKATLVHFAGGTTLYSHNQLYGRWDVVPAGKTPRTRRTLRVGIHVAGHSALLYSATDVAFWRRDRLHLQPYLARLGPDVLAPATTVAVIRARLDDPAFARRALTGLLLDQGFIAGLGNYLRSEILFTAGLLPTVRPADLTPARRDRLAAAIKDVSMRALKTGGVTNAPDVAAACRALGWPRRRWRFAVFRRPGETCHPCDDTIVGSTVGGRAMFVCPTCQDAPRPVSARSRAPRTTPVPASSRSRRGRPSRCWRRRGGGPIPA
jgi:endonuclease VIII